MQVPGAECRVTPARVAPAMCGAGQDDSQIVWLQSDHAKLGKNGWEKENFLTFYFTHHSQSKECFIENLLVKFKPLENLN